MKKIKRLIVLILMVALFVGGGAVVDAFDLDFIPKLGQSYDINVIEEKISEISEMATLEYNYKNNAVYDGGSKKFMGKDIPLTSKSMIVSYEGIIKMGSDMENIEVVLDEKADKVTITIPHSKILSHEIDQDTWEILDVKNGLFNRVTLEDNADFIKEIKAQIEEDVMSRDLLKQADDNTVKQLQNLLTMVYEELEVVVIFK